MAILSTFQSSLHKVLPSCIQVFSAEMFETKFKGNVLSKTAGREYRDKVRTLGYV